MTPEAKEFPTLIVASSVTGITMTGMTYSDVQRVISWLCGFDIWTHELVHGPTRDMALEECARQFPLMPTQAEAETDWRAAADKAIDAYGATVLVKRGTGTRRAGPVQTLKDIKPDARVIEIGMDTP